MLFLFSYQFPFLFVSTINDRKESISIGLLERKISEVYPKSVTFSILP